MARYVLLLNWTDQGIKAAKETVKRARAAGDAFAKAGGKMLHCFWTLGQHDLVIIAEAPNDEAVTAVGIQIGMLGNVRSTTLRAFDEAEFEQILKKL